MGLSGTVGSSAPTASLQMTPRHVGQLIPCGKGCHPQEGGVGLCELHEVQQGQVKSPAPRLGNLQYQLSGMNGLRAALRAEKGSGISETNSFRKYHREI